MRWTVVVAVAIGIAWSMPGLAGDALQDWLVAHAVIDGLDPYASSSELAETYGFHLEGGPAPRLPGAILLLLPYALIPAEWVTFASRLFVGLSIVAAWRTSRPPWWVAPMVAVPVISAMWWGNMSAIVTLLVALAIYRNSGVAVGVATVLRAWPWYLGLAMLVVGKWKPAVISAMVFFGLNGLGLLLPGVTVHGAVGAFAYSEMYLGEIFNLAIPLPVGLAVAGAFLVVLRFRPGLFRWSVLPGLWLSPAVWFYYLTVLMVPLAAIGRQRRGSPEERSATALRP